VIGFFAAKAAQVRKAKALRILQPVTQSAVYANMVDPDKRIRQQSAPMKQQS